MLAVLDPFQTSRGLYDFKKDTSHLLLLTLARRGYTIYYTHPSAFFADAGEIFTTASRVTVIEESPFFFFHEEERRLVKDFPIVLMRKDPPVDPLYLSTSYLLSLLPKTTLVINSPEALRNCNEKLVIFNFPQWIPKTLVTADKKAIDHFTESQGGEAVLKSLWGFAGQGVLRLSKESADYVGRIEEMTEGGRSAVMIQEYLPAVAQGEKRIFMIDGQPRGALLKIPPPGSWKSNTDGAHFAATKLTRREKKIGADLGPFLRKQGIFFAGVDLIDEKLTEINVTSPGLVCEWSSLDNRRYEEEIVDLIEKKLRVRS